MHFVHIFIIDSEKSKIVTLGLMDQKLRPFEVSTPLCVQIQLGAAPEYKTRVLDQGTAYEDRTHALNQGSRLKTKHMSKAHVSRPDALSALSVFDDYFHKCTDRASNKVVLRIPNIIFTGTVR